MKLHNKLRMKLKQFIARVTNKSSEKITISLHSSRICERNWIWAHSEKKYLLISWPCSIIKKEMIEYLQIEDGYTITKYNNNKISNNPPLDIDILRVSSLIT